MYNVKLEGSRYQYKPRLTRQDQIDRVLSKGGVKSLHNRLVFVEWRMDMSRIMNVEEARKSKQGKIPL